MFRFLLIILSVALLSSCRKDEGLKPLKTAESEYIVIGHAYGNPVSFQLRLYRNLIPFLANAEKLLNPDQYIFTGDIVAKATEENWENILKELDSLAINNYWIAPGNHDLGSSYFQENIQANTFFAERRNNNLFLVLNTNFSGWTVDQEQLNMINSELNNLSGIKNVFVFSHQVWWANRKNSVFEIDSIRTNSKFLLSGNSNFWTDAFPLFQKTDLPTYFFAGDIGAWDFIPAFVFNKFENYHFYASGIGGGADDNVIHIKTFSNGDVEVDKINF